MYSHNCGFITTANDDYKELTQKYQNYRLGMAKMS